MINATKNSELTDDDKFEIATLCLTHNIASPAKINSQNIQNQNFILVTLNEFEKFYEKKLTIINSNCSIKNVKPHLSTYFSAEKGIETFKSALTQIDKFNDIQKENVKLNFTQNVNLLQEGNHDSQLYNQKNREINTFGANFEELLLNIVENATNVQEEVF